MREYFPVFKSRTTITFVFFIWNVCATNDDVVWNTPNVSDSHHTYIYIYFTQLKYRSFVKIFFIRFAYNGGIQKSEKRETKWETVSIDGKQSNTIKKNMNVFYFSVYYIKYLLSHATDAILLTIHSQKQIAISRNIAVRRWQKQNNIAYSYTLNFQASRMARR